jgi:two-component system response regulator CpxR
LPVQQTLFRKIQTFLADVATGPSGETLPWQTPIDRSEFLCVVSFRADPRRPPSLVAARSTTKTFEPLGMAHTSVLLVDDDYELGQMLTEYLSAEAFTVITAADGASALKLAGKESFDIVLLDVMLPSQNGLDVLRTLRRTQSVPVIMLTARGTDNDRIFGLELGADDYLPKPFNPKELLARMRAVLRRTVEATAHGSSDVAVGGLRLNVADLDASVHGRALHLTGAEFRVLELLMRARGRTRSRELLTERVLGRKPTPGDRSIDTHISNLRRKLVERQCADVEIRNIRGAGYVLTHRARPA